MKKLLVWLPWGVAVGLVGLVARSVPLAEVGAALRGLQGWQLLALIVMNGLVLAALNGRWWIILRGQGQAISFLTLLDYRLAAFGVSYFTPGPHFGGEPVQVALVARHHQTPRSTAVAAVTLDKTLELLVNFSFLALGVAVTLEQRILGAWVGGETAVFTGLLVMMPSTFLAATWAGWQPLTRGLGWLGGRPWWPGKERWHSAFERLLAALRESEGQATRFCRATPHAFTAALFVSLLSWLLMIGEYWLMLRFLGLELTAVQTITLLTAARLAYLLPLPGGLGALEASQTFTLSLMGFDPAAGLSASLLIRARDVSLGAFGLWRLVVGR